MKKNHLREALEKIREIPSGFGQAPFLEVHGIASEALAKPDPLPDSHYGERDLATNPPKEWQSIWIWSSSEGSEDWYPNIYSVQNKKYKSGTWREQPPPPFKPKHLTIDSFYGKVQGITQITIDRFDTYGISDVSIKDLAAMRDYCDERLKEAGR